MTLLERITRLIKANLNDLAEKAENPEKLLKQLLQDMENQRLQVKTQVAIAIADWHVLEKKKAETLATRGEWVRKAELALNKGDETLARSALERSLPFETAAQNLAQQIGDQNYQIERLKSALAQLEAKLAESRSQADVLLARYRRARSAQRASVALSVDSGTSQVDRRVLEAESKAFGAQALLAMDDTAKFEELDREDRVDRLLASLRDKAS